jgi:phospholipid/cholesterol/gamma-HCH transport system substrate-binding protein
MTKSRLERKVGVFVFVGLVLLAGLLIEFSKGLTLFRSTYMLYLRASNAGTMKPHAKVLMSGVEVGKVSDISLALSGTNVVMALRIYSQYKIYTNAVFTIEQSGFLGDENVAISPTTNAGGVFQNGDYAHAGAPFNLQEVAQSASDFLVRVEDMAQKLNGVITDLRRYVLNEQTLTNLSQVAANLRAVSARAVGTMNSLDAVVSSNAPAIALSGSNLVAFSEQLNRAGAALNDVLATNGPAVQQAVKNIESSTDILKNLLNDVQAGKGTAGALLRNEQLAANMSQIVYNLSVTTSNLNRIGLWGILWSHKPPRTNAPSPTTLVSPKSLDEQN